MSRAALYCASLLIDWYAGRTGRAYRLVERHGGDPTVCVAEGEGNRLAVAVAPLFEPDSDAEAEDARAFMEERLSAGLVRGPFMLWAPPRAAVPSSEPEASLFTQHVQQAAAPLLPGARGEVQLPVAVQMAKVRDEGGYASVIGGLSRWWTLITERVNGTFHVNSTKMRRAPQSSQLRESLFDRIGELAAPMQTGDAIEFDTFEAWTVQRLHEEPLGETGFAIIQAPPRIDPADGTLMRRLVRRRLRDASEALGGVDATIKAVGLIAVYEYAEHETVGSFVKSLSPDVYAGIPFISAIVDGEVRPIFLPRE